MTPNQPNRRYTCPHCDRPAITYSTRVITKLVTERYVQCTNLDCECRFVVQEGIVRMTVASAMPSADVQVPLIQRRANDIVVARANTSEAQTTSTVPAPAPHHAGDAPVHAAH